MNRDGVDGTEGGDHVRECTLEVLRDSLDEAQVHGLIGAQDRTLHDEPLGATQTHVLGQSEGGHARQEAEVNLIELNAR